MRILGWFIDGFGVFKDYEVRGLPPGLTVFHGPNEAGKSTLLAFIRGVLFGFPHHRSKAPRYPPLQGGRHGGRVYLLGVDEEYMVERYAKRRSALRVTLPDGSEGSEADLRNLLGGVDATLFNSVFAFSLTELHSFDTLTVEGISNRIFSAGIAGAGRDARAAMARLTTRATELLKIRGRARINNLARELTQTRKRVKEAREAAKGYEKLVTQERENATQVEELTRRMGELQRDHGRFSTLLQLWPSFSELTEAREELTKTEAIDQFPVDPEIRLQSVLKDVKQGAKRLEELRGELQVAEDRCQSLTVDDAAAAAAEELETLYQALSLHRSRLVKLPQARRDLDQARTAAEQMLAELGSDWNVDRLNELEGSTPRTEEVRTWEAQLREASEACEKVLERARLATARTEELTRRKERVEKQLPEATPPDSASIDADEQAVRRLRTNRAELRSVGAELRGQKEVVRDRERACKALASAVAASSLPSWIVPVGWVAAAASAGVAVWRFASADITTGAIFSVFTIFIALAAYAAGALRQRAARDEEQRVAELHILRSELAEAEAVSSALRDQAQQLKNAIAADASSQGLPELPAAQQIEEQRAELERRRDLRRSYDFITSQLDELNAELDTAATIEKAVAEETRQAEKACEEVEAGWLAWKESAGLPPDLDPQAALEFLQAIHDAQQAGQTRKQIENQTAQEEADIRAWEDAARAVLAQLGEANAATLSGDDLAGKVLLWRKRCLEDQETRKTITALQEKIQETRSRIQAAEAELARAEQDRDHLFAEGGAGDEETFRRRLATYARRRELQAIVRDRDRQITIRLGSGQEAEQLRTELATGQSQQWQRRLNALADELETLQRQRDLALRAHRDAEMALRSLEESAEIATLQSEYRRILAEVEAAVRQWRTIVLAHGLIETTLRAFEHTRQPEVLAEATKTFDAVTGGRYTRVAQADKEGTIAIFDATGTQRSVEALSRGTAEQLYLCLRLGLAAELARRTQSLPIVMDDVLVNFDPGRARATAEALVDFSKGRQILFFTCHPSTRDMIMSVDGGVNVVEMEMVHPA